MEWLKEKLKKLIIRILLRIDYYMSPRDESFNFERLLDDAIEYEFYENLPKELLEEIKTQQAIVADFFEGKNIDRAQKDIVFTKYGDYHKIVIRVLCCKKYIVDKYSSNEKIKSDVLSSYWKYIEFCMLWFELLKEGKGSIDWKLSPNHPNTFEEYCARIIKLHT